MRSAVLRHSCTIWKLIHAIPLAIPCSINRAAVVAVRASRRSSWYTNTLVSIKLSTLIHFVSRQLASYAKLALQLTHDSQGFRGLLFALHIVLEPVSEQFVQVVCSARARSRAVWISFSSALKVMFFMVQTSLSVSLRFRKTQSEIYRQRDQAFIPCP